MGHIDSATRSLSAAGYQLRAYVDNEVVFGVDVLSAQEDKLGLPVLVPVGHAVFARSGRSDRPGFVFVEGRIGGELIAAVGMTPARALRQFRTLVASNSLDEVLV
jgi:hypothetical protein